MMVERPVYNRKFTEKKPAWLRKVLIKAYHGDKWKADNYGFSNSQLMTGYDHYDRIFDHVKYTTAGSVIIEPYPLSKNGFKALIQFCDENGLTFSVTGASPHNPGWTILIEICPEDKEEVEASKQ